MSKPDYEMLIKHFSGFEGYNRETLKAALRRAQALEEVYEAAKLLERDMSQTVDLSINWSPRFYEESRDLSTIVSGGVLWRFVKAIEKVENER